MTRFEIVKKALDDLWELIAKTDEDRIAKVSEAQQQLSNKYFNLNQKDCIIDYSSPATQFAYIFTYTGAHADIVYQLRECPAYTLLYQFFPKDTGKSKVK